MTPEDFELAQLEFSADLKPLTEAEFADVLAMRVSAPDETPVSSPVVEPISSPTESVETENSPAIAPLAESELEAYLFAAACRYTYRLDLLTPVAIASPQSSLASYANLPHAHRNQVFQYLTSRSDVVTDPRGRAAVDASRFGTPRPAVGKLLVPTFVNGEVVRLPNKDID